MKKLLVTLLLFLLKNFAFGQSGIIKFSLNDCALCNHSIERIRQVDADIPFTLVMEGRYQEDSLSIEKKFSLSKYKLPIIWSDSIYDAINKTQYSELIVFNNDKEIFRSDLKAFDPKSFNEKYVSLTSKNENSICNIYLPYRYNLHAVNKKMFIQNKVDDEFYVLDFGSKKIDTFSMNDMFLKLLFRNTFKDADSKYELAKKIALVEPEGKSLFTAFSISSDSVFYAVGMGLDFSCTKSDTIAHKVLSVYKFKNNKLENIYPVPSQSYTSLAISEESFYVNENTGKIYFSVFNNGGTKRPIHYLARFGLKNNMLVYEGNCNDTLPFQYIQNGFINMNVYPCFNNGYSILPFSNKIVNLDKETVYTIPFNDSIFKNLGEIKNPNRVRKFLPYSVWDFKYDPKNNKSHLVYSIYEMVYYMEFDMRKQEIEKNLSIAPIKQLNGVPVINDEYNRLYYYLKQSRCIESLSLNNLQ